MIHLKILIRKEDENIYKMNDNNNGEESETTKYR